MTSLLLAIIYLAFISLGLPDALLGSAWPVVYPSFGVPVSYAGIVSMIISAMTVVSSLMSDRLNCRFGTGRVTAFSVALTCLALFGFSFSDRFWMLCLWAVPYGLGAGSVDAALNNYVALHYASRHMSWLHCMWGIGASAGPAIMGFAITSGRGWNAGYRIVGFLQVVLTMVLVLSLPLWKKQTEGSEKDKQNRTPAKLAEVVRIPGAREVMITFVCYCALESTAGLWASSYLTLHEGIPAETAARFASLFYIGITAGRAASGFATMKLNDTQMIRLGQAVIASGLVLLLLPLGGTVSSIALVLIGIGCAPIYPSIIHSTPALFGADKSQAMIGVQMASAYVGTTLMPPFFGFIAGHATIGLYPVFLSAILALMVFMHAALIRKTAGSRQS